MSKVANKSKSKKIKSALGSLKLRNSKKSGRLTNFRIAPNLVTYGVTCRKFNEENINSNPPYKQVEYKYDIMDTNYPFTNDWKSTSEYKKIPYSKTKNLDIVRSLEDIIRLDNDYFLVKSGTKHPTYYVCSMRYKIVSEFLFEKSNKSKDIVISIFDDLDDINVNKFRQMDGKYILKNGRLSSKNNRFNINEKKFKQIDTFIEGTLTGFILCSIILFTINMIITSIICVFITILFVYTYAYINSNRKSIISENNGFNVLKFNDSKSFSFQVDELLE